MELVVVATFAFACLLLVCVFAYVALRAMSRSLDSAHRKIMARNYTELSNAEQSAEWARQTVNGQEDSKQRSEVDLNAAYYGEAWKSL